MSRSELDGLGLLRFVPDELRWLVEESFVTVSYAFGEVVVREGDPADAVYVITSGQARVVALRDNGDEVPLNTLGPGDSFGETGLINDRAVRSATVRASGELVVRRLDGGVFRALTAINPELLDAAQRAARHHALGDFLRSHDTFPDLTASGMDDLVDRLTEIEVAAEAIVITEGDPPGAVYIVRDGRLHARRDGRVRAFFGPGDSFGSSAALDRGPAPATVAALTPSRLLRISDEDFVRLAQTHPTLGGRSAHERPSLDYRGRSVLDPEEPEASPAGSDAVMASSDDSGAESSQPATPTRGPRRIRHFPLVWQVDEADCGAACVAMVCRYFGRKINLARVRDAVRTGIDGTSLRGIARGAAELGLAARTLKVSKRNLVTLPMPALLHWEGNHWVVAFAVNDRTVRLADPAIGLRRLPHDEVLLRWTGYAAVLSPTSSFTEVAEDTSGLRWLRPFFRPHRSVLGWAVLLALVISVLELSLPVFTKIVIDRVLPHRDLGLLHLMLVGLAAVVVLVTVGSVLQRWLLSRVALRIDGASLDTISAALLALPLRYFFARRTGDIQRRLSGVRQAREFLVRSGVAAISAASQLTAAVVLMIIFSPVLGLTYLGGLPIAIGLMRFSGRRLRPVLDSIEESFSRYYSRQIDAIKGIETVKALGAEDILRRSLLAEFDALARRLLRADLLTMLYDGSVQLLTFVELGLFLWLGSLQVLSGHLTLGGLVSFSALVALANGPVTVILYLWDQGQTASVLLDRVADVFVQEPEQGADRARLVPVPDLSGTVELRQVSFRYGGPDDRPILDGVTVRIPAGTKVAVVGRSGSGKTTLARCLAGLIEPTEGQILYDGLDLTTLDYRQLRQRMGVVLQENFLFSDTIARNIAFGDPEAELGEVVRVARLANAHEFVSLLPLGYETRVGDSGLLLSGGQRQRIAIARALYHHPPVLILDEATSSLDAESERAVKENLDRVLEGRTSFVIAHRLSTVRDADTILVLDQGRLVEQGTHTELMARAGLYAYLASEQLGL